MTHVVFHYEGPTPERPRPEIPGWAGRGEPGWEPWRSTSAVQAGTSGHDLVWQVDDYQPGRGEDLTIPVSDRYFAIDTGLTVRLPRNHGLLVLPIRTFDPGAICPVLVPETYRWWWPGRLVLTFMSGGVFLKGRPYARALVVPLKLQRAEPFTEDDREWRDAGLRWIGRHGDRYVTRRDGTSDNLYARLAHLDDSEALPPGLTGDNDAIPNKDKAGPPRLLAAPPRGQRPRPRGCAEEDKAPPAGAGAVLGGDTPDTGEEAGRPAEGEECDTS